ncbi:hypothetical protein [Ruminococcus sp.]|uniref:hypothetical protein n=1 Tax=Ruminococcus sp. TaxID=41978 RepID=UPI0026012DE9|nr:hypothetical protein [Ruminococcus sp.]MCR4637638.1 hypothetical protein [Ruminococcus sp.]
MKDYKDVARSVFRRRDEYLKEKKRKREVFMKRSAVALSCCLMMLVGFNIWRTDSLKTIAPSPDKSQFNVTEANTTSPPTTDKNGNTGIPVTTTVTATAPDGNNAVQHNTITTAVSDDTAPAVTTTRTKSGSSAVDVPLPTTYSFMEVTAVRRTTAVTTAAGRTTTTTQHKGAESSKTTARTTSTAPRTARTTTLTTVQPDIRTSRTTTAAYTTTGYNTSTTVYYTTGAVYSTTITYATSAVYSTSHIYTTSAVFSTTKIAANTTSKITDYPSPVATETLTTTTTAATTITTTGLTGFHYSGKYYKTTGIRVNKDQLGEYIGSEFDENTGDIFYIYKYGSLAPDFMCAAVIYGQNTGYIGVNETWQPETLGDLLDGTNAHGTMRPASLYDSSEKRSYIFSDSKAALDLMEDYRDKKLQIEGLSTGAQNHIAAKEGTEPPELDLSSKRGTIQVLTSGLADDGHYLHYGFIHITRDGKLEFDLLYLKYTADIGAENAAELMKRLKTI